MTQETYQDMCQSCGMPIKKPEDYGTKADSSQEYEYCTHCFQQGEFTALNITLEEMIKGCIGIMVQFGMPEEEATKQMEALLPTLKRWKEQ